jgi:hypothetical protein
MSKTILKISIILFSMFSHFLFANTSSNAANEQALLDIKVGIELGKLEQSAANIDQSIALASQALQEMAKNPNMNEQQQAKVITIFEHIDELALRFQTSIEALPAVINQSTPPITEAVNQLFSNVQLTIILVLIAIVLVLICALIAIYYWILKPTSLMLLKTTAKLDNMATALQTTAIIVEKNTEQQLLILNNTQKQAQN